MSLFDQLRPKWKHSDPAIRVEAVRRLDDQAVLESIVETDPDEKVRVAAIHGLTSQTAIARFAQSAESATVRESAVDRLEDRALLLRIGSLDPSATVRAHARAKCGGTGSASSHLREALAKLQVAERKAAQAAELCGTLDKVCEALSQDPRFFINGGFAPDAEDSGNVQLRDTTQVAWTTATLPSNPVVARFVAQNRQPAGHAAAVAGTTRFYHVKVWRTEEDRFEVLAEEKQFLATQDAVAWSRASSGGPHTQAAVGGDTASGQTDQA
jgi:hypothetical protein